ncbi:hypothetical protein OF850_21880 [Roseococcus sp. MDT2-1-1]|uniref:ApeA N-terminal domain-containing protein n=2 Tax=Sabulicella glaciei TaxID=2984948 RepID=A0ABT3P1I3_9PROT|nr:hypothetical protein [Roseococcus sp. MDT2-1-1]
MLAPAKNFNPPVFEDLERMHFTTDRTWIIEHSSGGGQPDRVFLSDPMDDTGSESLKGGEKLIFNRSFTGVSNFPETIEINQKLVHALDLYFLADRNAYCRLDEKGDIEEIIKITMLPKGKHPFPGRIVTIRADCLYEYMVLSGTYLIFKFDFTRYKFGHFSDWSDKNRGEEQTHATKYHYGTGPSASFVNGFMISPSTITYDDVLAKRTGRWSNGGKQYATFKIQDWRNKRLVEISCAPQNITNYFDAKPGLPFEVSPAFFRADVLSKYKADPDKYTIGDRTISCRNAWHLTTYDINEEGQVHTYIIYLSQLPYEEQLYWQAFNEWPKAPISKRAFETDYDGQFSTQYDPIIKLKSYVRALDSADLEWWKARGDELIAVVHLPASEAPAEWASEIMALDQMIVEGFQTKALRALLTAKGKTPDKEWGTIKLLEELLVVYGESQEDAKDVVAPLRTLHHLRSKLKGHGAVSERRSLEAQARSEFETFRNHFTQLAAGCDAAMTRIMSLLRPGVTPNDA